MNLWSAGLVLGMLSGASAETEAPASSLHEAVRHAVEQLEPLTKKDFAQDLRLSIAVRLNLEESPKNPVQIEGHILGTTYGLLDSLGIQALGQTIALQGQSDTDIDTLARTKGADWLLTLTLNTIAKKEHQLTAELRKVDGGLWSPLPRPETIYAHASARYGVSKENALPSAKASKLSKIHELKEHLVAIQSCEVDPKYPGPELITLSAKKVAVFRAGPQFLRRIADVKLRGLPRSQTKSRYPHGSILCAGDVTQPHKSIQIGHSDFAQGITISFGTEGKLKLRASDSKDAIVLRQKGKKLLASYAKGRPWWDKFTPSMKQAVDAIGFITAHDDSDTQGYLLNREYELFEISKAQQMKATPITSGAGISAYTNHKQELRFITTSSSASDAPESIRIQTPEGEILHEFSTPLPVMTTTTLPADKKEVTRILFASPRMATGRTTIFHIEVSDL